MEVILLKKGKLALINFKIPVADISGSVKKADYEIIQQRQNMGINDFEIKKKKKKKRNIVFSVEENLLMEMMDLRMSCNITKERF